MIGAPGGEAPPEVKSPKPGPDPRTRGGCVTLATTLVLASGVLLAAVTNRLFVDLYEPREMGHMSPSFGAVLLLPWTAMISIANFYAWKACVGLPRWCRALCLAVAILDLLAVILWTAAMLFGMTP